MLAYLFPGQGSQSLGMGKSLFGLFKEYIQQAEELLGYSIEALCTQDPHQQLNNTQYTQPALFVVNAMTYLKTLEETQQIPDYVAGHSLGEYSALFAAGVFDFPTGLALVKKRGELMSQAQGGGMAAILGLPQQEITYMLQKNDLSTVTIANYNSHQQNVVSGPKNDIARAQSVFNALPGITFIPLKVSGAFHSPYLLTAQQAFSDYIQPLHFSTPKVPVIANVTATPYHPIAMKTYLTNQITHPVQWTKTITYLQTKPGICFKEIGPGNVLTNLVQRIYNQQ